MPPNNRADIKRWIGIVGDLRVDDYRGAEPSMIDAVMGAQREEVNLLLVLDEQYEKQSSDLHAFHEAFQKCIEAKDKVKSVIFSLYGDSITYGDDKLKKTPYGTTRRRG